MSNLVRAATLAALVVAATITPAQSSQSTTPLLKERVKYNRLYYSVVERYNRSVAGTNIRKHGVLNKRGTRRKATAREIAISIWQLRALNNRYLSPSRPRTGPSRAMSVKPAVGLPSCIVHSESRGDPQARNGQYTGIAQWSPEAWSRHGGLTFAPRPTSATLQQQLLVLAWGLGRYGCRDWCPFNPC